MRSFRRSRGGRRALGRFKRFHGIRNVPAVKLIGSGGRRKKLVSLGRSPALYLKARGRNVTRRHNAVLATNAGGTRFWILRDQKRGLGNRLKFLGTTDQVDYVLTGDIERAGSPKRNTHWQHFTNEDGGKPLKVYEDQFGNYHLRGGTMKAKGLWLRK